MPSEKILAQKKEQVTQLAEKFKNASAGVLVDYKGITVTDDTALRKKLRESGVYYSVQKNTMIKLAAKQAGLSGFDEVLNGTTAIALSDNDLVAPAKLISEFAEKHESFKVKAGFIEGKFASEQDVLALAKLPPKEQLVAKVLYGFNAPISGLANVLNANLRGLVVALNAIAEKQSA